MNRFPDLIRKILIIKLVSIRSYYIKEQPNLEIKNTLKQRLSRIIHLL